MLRAVHTASTGMEAMQTHLDNIANNLANVNTTAYKKSKSEFQDLFYETIREPGGQNSGDTQAPTGIQVGVGVKTSAISKVFTPGAPKVTKRQLDFAILGAGFFAVQRPNGEIAYTRDGNLNKDGQGRIVTTNGYPIVPTVTIPPGTVGISVTADGTVKASSGDGNVSEIGNIELVNFINPSGLKALGGNLYQVSESSGEPVQGKPGEAGMGGLEQGALEGSNVNVVSEMVNMIQAQRAYEMNSKVLQAADSMMSTSTSTLR